MSFGYHFEGVERVNAGLGVISQRVDNLGPLFELLGVEFYRQETEWFEAEPWTPLSPAYAEQKREEFGDKPILRAIDVLLRSFTQRGAEGNIHRVSNSEAEFGSSDFKAILHQLGTAIMPARPPFREPDTERYRTITGEYMDQIMQDAGF